MTAVKIGPDAESPGTQEALLHAPTMSATYPEEVRFLYRLSGTGYIGTMATVGIVAVALWNVVDNALLSGWFAAVCVVTLGRYLLYRAYQAAPETDKDPRLWANRFLVGAVAMGCMWGFLGTALFPADSPLHQFVVIFSTGGVTMAAAVVLTPVMGVFYGFALPALLPLAATLFLQGDPTYFLMGVMAVFFTLVMLRFAHIMKENLHTAIRIKFENADLVEQLSTANRAVEQANQQLEAKVDSLSSAEQALRQASQKLEALVTASPLAIVVRDKEGRVEKWNAAAERMFGWSEAELRGRHVPWYPPGREEEGPRYRRMILGGVAFSDVESERLRKDGTRVNVSGYGAPILDERGQAAGALVIVADITARKRAETRQALQTEVTKLIAESDTVEEATPRLIQAMCEKLQLACGTRWVLDPQKDRVHCVGAWGITDPAVQAFISASRERTATLVGSVAGVTRRVWHSAKPVWVEDVTQDPLYNRRDAALRAGLRTAIGFPVLVRDEFYGVIDLYARGVWPRDDELLDLFHYLGSQIGQFIARKQAEQNLQFVATHDSLTGLPNRVMFSDRLSQALAQAQRYSRRLAVMFVDLDGFKNVNDAMGHSMGDVVLREVGARLRGSLREGDIIGRIGGDEFVVLIEQFEDHGQISDVAEKIIEAVARPMVVHGQECSVTASVGVSAYPQDGKDSQTLLKNADTAMYRAKEQGKNRFRFYSV